MLRQKIHRSARTVTGRISSIMTLLLQDEATSARFLVAAAIAALVIANTSWSKPFDAFWQQHLSIGIGHLGISETLKDWIDQGLMAIFFLIIGLEVKREMIRGELSTLRATSLPVIAALGGMLLAIGIYAAANIGHASVRGWGIPMTTDTALALSVLALVSSRMPATLKIFLMAVMVVDDLAAIIAIAVFYSSHIHLMPLAGAALVLLVMLGLQWVRLMHFSAFVFLGILLWLCIHASGVHASIAGAIMGLAAPIVPRNRKITSRAIAERLERNLIPVTTFCIIPLFALTNTGIDLRHLHFSAATALPITLGIAGGLLLGKSLGIIVGTWVVVRSGITSLPEGVRWGHIIGASVLAGIGFTLSIFIADLAFSDPTDTNVAKAAVFGSSLVAAAIGLAILRLLPVRREPVDDDHF